jgi:hypothetical protein
VLVGDVVDDQIDDHLDAEVLGLVQQLGEVAERPQARVDVVEVGRVVPVVVPGRRVDRMQPQARHTEPRQVVQAPDQPPDVAYAIAVRVLEGVDVGAVHDGFLIPTVTTHGYR